VVQAPGPRRKSLGSGIITPLRVSNEKSGTKGRQKSTTFKKRFQQLSETICSKERTMALITLLYFVFIFVLINLIVQIVLYVKDAKERMVLKMRLSKQFAAPIRQNAQETGPPFIADRVPQ
jgi:hypothetical protein